MPQTPKISPQHTRMGRAKRATRNSFTKSAPTPWHCTNQQSSTSQYLPLLPIRAVYFVIHLSPSGFVRFRRMGSCQHRKHVIRIKLLPISQTFPLRQVAQVKRAEGTCRAAGWTLQSWLAVHLSTRGKSRPSGAFVRSFASRVRHGVLDLDAL